MNASQNNRKLIVNENPDIVITSKGENLSNFISELGVNFEGKMEVGYCSFIAKELVIN